MEINTLRTAVTLLAFLAFIGILVWAYLPKHRDRFEQASRLPFMDDEDMQPTKYSGSSRG